MAETKSECEDIARRLDLPVTSAFDYTSGCRSIICLDCYNQSYYRCRLQTTYRRIFKDYRTSLHWNPECADNAKDQRNSANLCVQSGN